MGTPCSPRRMSIKGSRILLRPEESCQAARRYSWLDHYDTRASCVFRLSGPEFSILKSVMRVQKILSPPEFSQRKTVREVHVPWVRNKTTVSLLFNTSLKVKIQGSCVTSDGSLILVHELKASGPRRTHRPIPDRLTTRKEHTASAGKPITPLRLQPDSRL